MGRRSGSRLASVLRVSDEDQRMRERSDRGFTLIELMIVVSIISVIAVVAVPGLLRARMAGNEASAVGSMRAIYSGQSAFSSSCAANGYAQALEDLYKPPSGGTQGFISPDLQTTGILKSGYFVTLTKDAGAVDITPPSKTCNASTNAAVSSYFAEAHPAAIGSTGQRSFGLNTRGTIYYDATGATMTSAMSGASILD